MAYVYSKRGSSFGQSDEDGGAQANPLTALQSVRSVYPSIVSGAAPTHSSTLSQEDVPTYMPSRTLTQSPSVAVEAGAASLAQALYQPPAVDKGYQDASLFSDVPIRPTLSVSENPAAMPSKSVKTMQQAYASEVMPSQLTTAYVNTGMSPLTPVKETLPPIISASTYAPPAGATTGHPSETQPAASLPKQSDSLFDALHPNAVYVEPDPATAIYPTQVPTGSTVPTSDDPGAKVPYETGDMWGAAGAQAGAAAAGGGYLPSTIEQQAAAQQSAAGQGSSVIPLVAGAALLAYLLLGR